MLRIWIKTPANERGESMVDDAYVELIRRACQKVSDDLGPLSRYVPEFDVTFNRMHEGIFSPVITAVISSENVAPFAFTKGNLLEPGVTKPPTEDEIVASFYELQDAIIDLVGFWTIVWGRLVDGWNRIRHKFAHFAGL